MYMLILRKKEVWNEWRKYIEKIQQSYSRDMDKGGEVTINIVKKSQKNQQNQDFQARSYHQPCKRQFWSHPHKQR